ncbi:flavodoxin domain-containing protein [Sanguibacter keddieii]|uniref:flavodoxin domain-containing protein n=1 Tax=Sanguibacter keddieii TaxID=60920 RepID=UPI0005A7A15A|nr:flavodoxin domain-containing protein [Sanguibacter keddieii]
MRVLVSAASKHGSTREIAAVVAQALESAGIACDVVEPADVATATGYDAVVVGSAVYIGQWLPDARDLVDRLAEQLREVPVWLFSSGLADQPSKRGNSAPATTARVESLGARGHRHFPGKLDVLQLSLAERATILAARGKYGDNRDMDAVRAWGEGIAAELVAEPARTA